MPKYIITNQKKMQGEICKKTDESLKKFEKIMERSADVYLNSKMRKKKQRRGKAIGVAINEKCSTAERVRNGSGIDEQ